MFRVYVLVENGSDDPLVDGSFEFAAIPRIGEFITIGTLGKDAFYRVTEIVNHATIVGDRLQPLERIEIKAEVVK